MKEHSKKLSTGKTVSGRERKLAAQEATLAFHTTVYSCSFTSMDSTTAIIKTLFNQKMTCCQTKPRRLSPSLWYYLL
jgi:hypothetical protein